MTSQEIKRSVSVVCLFGVLTALFGRIEFDIPGAMGVKSNFAEVALVASLPFLTRWQMAPLLAVFTVFNVSSIEFQNLFPESFNHVLGMVFLYATYQRIRQIPSAYLYVAALVAMIAAYYYLILIPFVFAYHFLSGEISLHRAIALIVETNKSVLYEWLTTTAISVMFSLMYREYERRLGIQQDLLRVNVMLQNNVETLTRIAFVDAATGLPNGLQLEKDISELSSEISLKNGQSFVLGGFMLEGLASLNHEKGFDSASRIYSSIITGFAHNLEAGPGNLNGYQPPKPVKLCYRVDASVVIFMMTLPDGISGAAEHMKSSFLKIAIQKELDRHTLKTQLAFRGCVTFYPEDAESVQQLVRNLLNMLYAEDAANRGYFSVFNPAQYRKYLRTEELRQHVHKGIEKGEFYMVFQPKIDAAARSVYGFEALARWQSAELGNVPPFEFIPVVERYQFIDALTRLLLKDVFRFIHALRGLELNASRVAINISPDLLNSEFLGYLVAEIGKEGVFQNVEVEITESMITAMAPQTLEDFRKLKRNGVTVAIDDFGTGYSNLSSLQSFEPDVLKIDKSFVDGIPADEKSCKLVKAVVDIAGALSMDLVAEGVESMEQSAFLLGYGCNVMQGYVYAKPLSFESALQFARDGLQNTPS